MNERDYQYRQQEWDEQLMSVFQFEGAKTSWDIMRMLNPITKKIGFQIKLGQEVDSNEYNSVHGKINQAYLKYIKVDCAFPLRQCPFYLLYRIDGDKTLLFACHLVHSHQMGPISA